MDHNNYLFVLCGVPGSGKTTLSEELAQIYNAKIHSYDEVFNKCKLTDKHIVRIQMLSSMVEDLRNGFNIVCDDVNTRINWRAEVLSMVESIDCYKILVVMTTSLNECLSRNANRKKRVPELAITHTYRNYQPPSLEEGWDEILYY